MPYELMREIFGFIVVMCVVVVFFSLMFEIANAMIKDQNVGIRFLGYMIAVVTALIVLRIMLNFCLNINILTWV